MSIPYVHLVPQCLKNVLDWKVWWRIRVRTNSLKLLDLLSIIIRIMNENTTKWIYLPNLSSIMNENTTKWIYLPNLSSGISIFKSINKMLLQIFKLSNYLNSLRYLNTTRIVYCSFNSCYEIGIRYLVHSKLFVLTQMVERSVFDHIPDILEAWNLELDIFRT